MTWPIRKVLAAAAAAIVCVLILQAVFVASLTLVRAHTDLAAIRGHITQAFADGVLSNDERPRLLIHRYGHQFTECTGLHLSIDDQPDPLKAALLPQLHSKYVGPCGELERSAAGIATPDRTDYARYWHGYRLYIWPMLEHFSLQNVRFINAALLLAAVVFFFASLRRVIGDTPAAVFFVVLMALTDIWRMWNITTHFLSTAIILAGAGLFARSYLTSRGLIRSVVLAAVFGAVFNFADFLINPPMMPMLLAFIVIAVALRDVPRLTRPAVMDTLTTAGLVALAWFGGYALTWASEWTLAAYVSADSGKTWAAIIKQIALRLYGTEPDSVVPIYPLVPTLTMIVQSFISVGSVFVAILAAALVVHARNHWAAFDWRRFLLLSSPTLIATAWFELLNNHTQTHSHFTYRSESAAIAIVFAAFVMATAAPVSIRSLLTNLWAAIRPARKRNAKA
jgi:hypothetical protein